MYYVVCWDVQPYLHGFYIKPFTLVYILFVHTETILRIDKRKREAGSIAYVIG